MSYVTFFCVKVCPKFGQRNIGIVVRGGTAGGSSEQLLLVTIIIGWHAQHIGTSIDPIALSSHLQKGLFHG